MTNPEHDYQDQGSLDQPLQEVPNEDTAKACKHGPPYGKDYAEHVKECLGR